MIGYLIEIELTNRLPADRRPVVMLTMIEVDPGDPAFQNPTKPIGPIYTAEEAEALAAERHWTFKPDGDHVRRVVASPVPQRIVEQRQIVTLLDAGYIVVCAGGGGIPIVSRADGVLEGVEAVIDKDHASALLAREIGAEVFVMATDTPAAFVGFGTPDQRAVLAAHPDAILADHGSEFAAGSMLPKVTAACDFARSTGQRAVIGQLADIDSLVAGTAGTQISIDTTGVVTGELSSSKET